MDEPTVGRIVHYTSSTGTKCIAALVTAVCPGHDVNLAVFYPDGGFAARQSVRQAGKEKEAGTWHWPERTGGLVTTQVYIGQDVPETVVPLKKQKDHE